MINQYETGLVCLFHPLLIPHLSKHGQRTIGYYTASKNLITMDSSDAYYLTSPSNCPNQYWLSITGVLWHSHEDNFQKQCSRYQSPKWVCKFDIYDLQWQLLLPPAHDLTHCGLVRPYFIIDLGQNWLRQWLGACLAMSHYLNQCWLNAKSYILLGTDVSETLIKSNNFHSRKWIRNCCQQNGCHFDPASRD